MKKRTLSGVQPSGNLHIGNYLGAIKNWVGLQDDYEAIFCIVDMHAITVPQDPKVLREKIIEIVKIYLACGIDPKKSAIFVQSQVKEHAELAWILNCVARMGELEKMTQFKDKSGIMDFKDLIYNTKKIVNDIAESNNKYDNFIENVFYKIKQEENFSTEDFLNKIKESNAAHYESVHKLVEYISELMDSFRKKESVGVGLFDYPVLMAADILLYDTAVVPVGEDQLQHIELTRTLGRRFNKRFGDTFIIPKAEIRKEGKRIMGLDNPEKKMSKSADTIYNYIALNDDVDSVRKKIRKAVTDSGSKIVYQDDKPALKNLINIYSLLADKSISEIEEMYKGKGYGDFKNDLADVINNFLTPFQERFNAISDEEVMKILEEGAEKVRKIAEEKIREVKEKVGFLV